MKYNVLQSARGSYGEYEYDVSVVSYEGMGILSLRESRHHWVSEPTLEQDLIGRLYVNKTSRVYGMSVLGLSTLLAEALDADLSFSGIDASKPDMWCFGFWWNWSGCGKKATTESHSIDSAVAYVLTLFDELDNLCGLSVAAMEPVDPIEEILR